MQELSKLNLDNRQEYLEAFTAAKQAYAAGQLAESESYLVTCQLICDKNPNVWSLRACICINQKRFDEALYYMQKAENDPSCHQVVQLSYSLYYLAKGEYQKSITSVDALLEEITNTQEPDIHLCHSLLYRKLLCLLILGEKTKAQAITDTLSPMDDTPLYYYSQAAYSISEKNMQRAQENMRAADSIFGRTSHLQSYKQALSFSNFINHFIEAD